jgi:flagellar hook-length control protein FliK
VPTATAAAVQGVATATAGTSDRSKPAAAAVRPARADGPAPTTGAATGHAGAAARTGMATDGGATGERRPHSEAAMPPAQPATATAAEPAADTQTAQTAPAGAGAPAAGQAPAAADAGRTDVAPAAPAPATDSPAARPDSAASATVTARARMQDLADVTGATMRMAVRSGQPIARITLHPGDLGDVQVTMRYHQDGVSAILTTDNHDAAAALLQAGADLRRSLEAQGVTVHGLDVHLSGDDRGGNARGERAADMAHAMGPSGGDDAADDEAEITIQPSQLPLSGSQIDVFA